MKKATSCFCSVARHLALTAGVLVGLLMSCPSTASAATYYVATSGNDTNAGSLTAPFRTVQRGVSVLAAGDTLYVRGGTYIESCSVVPRSGTATSPITIARYQAEQVTFQPCSIVSFSNVSYVVFDGFIIDARGADSDGLWVGNGSHHVIVRNLEIKNSGAHGAQVNVTTDSIQLIRLKIHDNGNDYYDNAVYIESSNNIIDGCEIYSNTGTSIQLWREDGATFTNNIVRNNYIHDTSGDVSIARGGAAQLQGIVVGHASNTMIYNNVIANMSISTNRIMSMGDAAISLYNDGSNNVVYNNTVYNIRNADGIQVDSRQSGTPRVTNNIVHATTSAINNRASGTVLANNLTTDPQFVSVAENNFRLQSGSPAIDTGTVISAVTQDSEGTPRPQGASYDIGAYEYRASSSGTPPQAPTNVRIVR